MPKVEKEIVIMNKLGLHARPAALFVRIASKYSSDLNILKNGEKVNGKSIMTVLTLEAHQHTTIHLEAEGTDAQEMIDELEELLLKEEIYE